ncbi:MAG: tRNA pseudouridine(13) synthase TruD [archaeon]|nr:tRNA pseudouridine(13) synthase TruD [archaeon]
MSFRKCTSAEADIGMLYYISDNEGTGGRLKAQPEDFVVDEISSHPEPADDGRFTIAKVTARNWETNHMIRLLSRQMGISRERIGFAGTKDKRAVTSQLMSFEGPPSILEKVDLQDLTITEPYKARRRIQIGDLIGNRFTIRATNVARPMAEVRDVCEDVIASVKATGGFPNYFGVQRFGVMRPITHKVGEYIVRGDIRGAVRCYVCEPANEASQDVAAAEARKRLSETDDWASLYDTVPDSMSFEKNLIAYLRDHPEDWTGAIASMPTNLQMMFVHAYQSYLFNLMLSERIARGIPLNRPIVGDVIIPLDADGIPQHESPVIATARNIDLVERQIRLKRAFVSIPLFGSESKFSDGEMGEIERMILEREKIDLDDFVVPGLSHCSSEGSWRELLCPVKDLGYNLEEESYQVSFSLPKGNYATCLMREFMKSEMTDY